MGVRKVLLSPLFKRSRRRRRRKRGWTNHIAKLCHSVTLFLRKYEKMSKIDTLDTLDDATNTILTINLDTLFEKI